MFFKKISQISQAYERETPLKVLSYEICEIFKNTIFYNTTPMAASVCPIFPFYIL